MKKLILITILVSLSWGQEVECQYDGSKMMNTYDSKVVNGKLTYKWECPQQHISWITTENADAMKQSQRQQQVMPNYDPVLKGMGSKDGFDNGYEEGLAWNAMMKEKHPILLKVFQGVVLYGCYLLIQGEID